MHRYANCDIVMANPSVCLYRKKPEQYWYCIETNAHIVKLFPPSGRAWL